MSTCPRLAQLSSDAFRVIGGDSERSGSRVAAAIKTGMRVGELRALRWEDIDFVATCHSRCSVSSAMVGASISL